ncbi:ABC transporter substrate-binding protein [bacterium]|jgi:branched-chain amino acid transport system substrate-binding protein|nr:ABC transporter substrate-binding protein [bacterium]
MKNRFIMIVIACIMIAHNSIGSIENNQLPIKIGMSMALSGPAGDLGQRLLKGIQPVIQRVNQEGGVKGRKIQLIIKDDQYKPDLTVKNTIKMLKHDQVDLFFSFVGTPTVSKVAPLFLSYDRMLFFPFTGAENLRLSPLDGHIYHNRPSYWVETKTIVDYLVTQGKKKIAIFFQHDSFGQNGRVGVIKTLKKYQLEPTLSVNYRRNQFDVEQAQEVADMIHDSQSDAVICIANHSASAKLIKAIRETSRIPIANVSFADPIELVSMLIADDKSSDKEHYVSQLIHSIVVPYDKVIQTIGHFDPIRYEGYANTTLLTQLLDKISSPISQWTPQDVQKQLRPSDHSFIIHYQDGSWKPI